MKYSEGLTGAPPVTVTEVPLELLEEMLWFFRVEDATPWNSSMFVLAALVVIISFILLGRNIQANRLSGSIRLSKVTSETRQLSSGAADSQTFPCDPNRNQKKLPSEKQTPEVLYLAEGGNKDDNNLTILTETLLSEKPSLAQGEVEAKHRDVPLVRLPDPQESES